MLKESLIKLKQLLYIRVLSHSKCPYRQHMIRWLIKSKAINTIDPIKISIVV